MIVPKPGIWCVVKGDMERTGKFRMASVADQDLIVLFATSYFHTSYETPVEKLSVP